MPGKKPETREAQLIANLRKQLLECEQDSIRAYGVVRRIELKLRAMAEFARDETQELLDPGLRKVLVNILTELADMVTAERRAM